MSTWVSETTLWVSALSHGAARLLAERLMLRVRGDVKANGTARARLTGPSRRITSPESLENDQSSALLIELQRDNGPASLPRSVSPVCRNRCSLTWHIPRTLSLCKLFISHSLPLIGAIASCPTTATVEAAWN